MLREAARQAGSWLRAGNPLQVAVNISPRNLLDEGLAATVLTVLDEHGVPAGLIELEVTETAIMIDPERAASVLRSLADMGIKISIDDFGAGYTSLAYLRTLPVAALKIDRSLVGDMLHQPADEAITAAVIALGHRLGMSVLAEGVETDAVLQRLSELSCAEAQGYLLSRPVPPAALEGWLAEHAARQVSALPSG